LAMAGLRLQFVPQTPDDAPRFDGTMMMLNTPQQLSVAVLAARPNFPIPSPVSQFSLHSLPLHLPSCLDVSFGALEFSMSELRGLAKGDVLLLRESDIELLPAQLRINAHAVWSGSLTTTGSFKAIAPERETSVMTTDDEITAGSVSVQVDDATTLPMLEADRSASDLIDLPMLVDFQFHRKTMALSEISSIAPGAILDLGLDLSDPIVIRINEKAVGTGRLIQIGDRVGIQIERWTDETKRAWS
jgi:type III secretion system YscQ/HrcQ family protein